MWNMKCMIIRVIPGPTRKATKCLKEVLKAVPGKHSMDSIENIAVLGTYHIIRKVLQSETEF
jgi:hypothetical protein